MSSGRLQSIDVYRGLAIIAMVAYHAIWDLNFNRLIDVGIGVEPLWISLQRGILTTFLLLAGAGLTLAHGNAIRWRGFWRREAILVVAALGVSVVTWLQFGPYFAYFGVLHAIALFSLMALPMIRGPLWVGIGVAIIVIFLPAVFSADAFSTRWLAWIGFFTTTPETADLVPVFPWFGVMLIGVLGMRVLREAPAFAWSSRNAGIKVLALIGRWSLIIYLVHQPLLFGIITPIAIRVHETETARLEGFLQSCRTSCAPNGTAAFCTAYCACALDLTVRDNLWSGTADELRSVVTLCTEMAR